MRNLNEFTPDNGEIPYRAVYDQFLEQNIYEIMSYKRFMDMMWTMYDYGCQLTTTPDTIMGDLHTYYILHNFHKLMRFAEFKAWVQSRLLGAINKFIDDRSNKE